VLTKILPVMFCSFVFYRATLC